ncbi:MAG: acyltransferase family protein [Dehalococcoidales bacterium]|nr:acyltransferase family protein [Dehalococcoidales bacterium]
MLQTPLQPSTGRLSHLDWLRIIVVAMLIPFHAAMTFTPFAWYVNNPQSNLFLQGFVSVIDKYQMELLFFVAGIATFFSFGVRTWRAYLKERLLRLVVPLVFGMLVIVPPCYYFAGLYNHNFFPVESPIFEHNYWRWFVNDWLKISLPFQNGFSAGALWFLWYLVFITFALFPALYFIYKKYRGALATKFSGFFAKPGSVLIFAIPIILLQVLAEWQWTIGGVNYRVVGWIMTGDFQVLYYAAFFVLGFLLYANEGVKKGIDRSGLMSIIGAVITMSLYLMITFPEWNKSVMGEWFWTTFKDNSWHAAGRVIFNVLLAVTTWSWIIAILYLGRRFLDFSNRFVKWGNDAVLPIYIVHSTFIAVLSYFIVRWSTPILWKYLAIVILTYIGSLAFLELFKLTSFTRFLMGIRQQKKGKSPT